MKITQANLRRLASLSALGAGAWSASTGTAEASSIVYSGILDDKIGFGRGYHSAGSFVGPNIAGAIFRDTSRTAPQHSAVYGVKLFGQAGSHGTHFRFLGTRNRSVGSVGSVALAFPLQALWGTAVGGRKIIGEGLIGIAAYSYGAAGSTIRFKSFNSIDRYLLFEFSGGSLPETLYGWAQLDVIFNKSRFPGAPAVTLVDWAYDTSGAPIPAGDTGAPEPSTFALTGLAALALGARGLRAWRAGRK